MAKHLRAEEPCEYRHAACGGVTRMPQEVIEEYLEDPDAFAGTTFCAHCRREVPDAECSWVETGERLDAYMRRLQRETNRATYRPTAEVDLRPNGIRRFLAIALFFVAVVLPIDAVWRAGGLEPQAPVPDRHAMIRPPWREAREPAAPEIALPFYLWPLAIVGGIFSLALYAPAWGCKRYALLFGPVAAGGALMFLKYWLTGRQEIYRFEPVIASMIGAAPGVALWAALVLRKLRHKAEAGPRVRFA